MWRFLDGVKPPEPKKRKTDEEKRETQKQYDQTKRVRQYNSKWESEFSWLLYDQKGKMFCRTCRAIFGPLGKKPSASYAAVPEMYKRYAGGPFVSGTQNLKHSTLLDHEKSNGHKTALGFMEKRTAKPGTSSAEKALASMNKEVFQKLDKLFRMAHAIAKHSRPFSDMIWMSELEHILGVDLGKTYNNDKSCRKFINSIAETERLGVDEMFKSANFLTVLSDGSVDVSVRENEIVYGRFCNKGNINIVFLGIVSVPRADANGIFNAILKALNMTFFNSNENEIYSKIVAYGSDGASVNTGEQNGVIAKLRQKMPAGNTVVIVHCLVHRLELAYKKAFKAIKLYDKVISLLSNLYSFYHKSALQRSNLKTAFHAMNMSRDICYPTRIGGTRWLGHTLLALEKLWRAYPALVMHLGQVSESREPSNSAVKPKAVCMLKLLKSRAVIVFGHFLQDLLAVLSKVSKVLQERDSSIYESHHIIHTAELTIKKYADRNGYFLNGVVDCNSFKGTELTGSLDMFNETRNKAVDNLLLCLQDRFKDISDGLLNATKVADLSTWPVTLDSMNDYGDQFIQEVVTHFQSTLLEQKISLSCIDSEWTSLKSAIYKDHERVDQLNWELINKQYGSKHANILAVIYLILTLPASSAECERGFSNMKIIKSSYRNRLSDSSLSDLMAVQLLSHDICNFDPQSAIHHWNSASVRCRRPNFLGDNTTDNLTLDSELDVQLDKDEDSDLEEKIDSDHDDVDYDSAVDSAPELEDVCSDID